LLDRPATVAFVTDADTVLVACGVAPRYGVMTYELAGPPPAGAVQERLADVRPPSAAVTPVTFPEAEPHT